MNAESLPPTSGEGGENPARHLPYAFAKRHGVLVVDEEDGRVTIAYRPGISTRSLTELRRFLNAPLRPVMVPAEHFERMLQDSYEGDSDGAARMMEDLGEEIDLNQVSLSLPEPEDLLESADDAPIIRLINALLTGAIKENASDIHIESFENRLMVRFRVDGVLREALQPPRALGPLLVSRVKVMAHLDIAEKRLPQDGAQTTGERHFHLGVHLGLTDAVEVILDRIFDGHDISLAVVEPGQPRVQGSGLAGPGRTGDQDDAVWALNQSDQTGLAVSLHAQML